MDPKFEQKLHGSGSPWSPQVRTLNSKVKNEVDLFDAQTRYMAAKNANNDKMQCRHIPKHAQTKIGFKLPTGFENRARKVSP